MIPPLFAICSVDPVLQGLLGTELRLYPWGEAPLGVLRPYAVYQIVNGTPENYLGDRSDMDAVSLQIDVYSDVSAHVKPIAEAIRDVIEDDCTITAFRGWSREEATKLYRWQLDTDWFLER